MSFSSILRHLKLLLLLTALLLFSRSFANDEELGTTSDSSFIVSSFNYPETKLSPFGSRYIRVDIPPSFSAMSIALNSDVDLDIARVESVPDSELPIICLRDGSPPLPDTWNTPMKDSVVTGINGLDVEQCFPMQKNITMRLTNEQISAGVWYVGVFNGFGPRSTQSKMIVRGTSYSFSANISVEACINSMMSGKFCNSTIYPLSCTASNVYRYYTLEASVKKPMTENVMTCKSNRETFCVQEGVPNFFSLDITNMAEELTITATNVTGASGVDDFNLTCFARHGAMPSETLHDYSSDLNKAPLVIRSPLIGRLYISILAVNPAKKSGGTSDSIAKVCYSVESQVVQCPLGKAGPNCTIDSYTLQTVISKGPTPFESYYLPVGEGASSSANFPLEPFSNNSLNGVETDNSWTFFTLDIPLGAAGRNIHIQLSSDVKIRYEVYTRFGGLPSLDSWDYYYANDTRKSNESTFFMLYDSSEDKIDFYIIYAREGTWGFGLRHLNSSSDSSEVQTIMSLSLEGCPKRCSSHGDCEFSFDASGLTSYSFCSCDRSHGGFDCSVEIVSHYEHVLQAAFLIGSNAAALLPAYWSLRQKAFAEWIIFTSSGVWSALYHACDVGTWCVMTYNVLQFMDFWLSFMAVISTFVYLVTINEVYKRAIHTAVAIFTALMAVTQATRSSNITLVIVIGFLGLLIGGLIEFSSKYRSHSFSMGSSLNFHRSLSSIKESLSSLAKTLLRRLRWRFALAGFVTLVIASASWLLETSETYWFWHSFWHVTIFTSSFLFLCSKANIVEAENWLPSSENYVLTRQDSFPRGNQKIELAGV